jgi:hypothetical protein
MASRRRSPVVGDGREAAYGVGERHDADKLEELLGREARAYAPCVTLR